MNAKSNKLYDLLIVGAGPGGLTAAIYASRREMDTAIIGKEVGGQMVLASEIENYPGFKSIESVELITRMQDQVKALGVNIIIDDVKEIVKNDDENFTIFTNRESYRAKTVIIAMGLIPRRLAIPGEEEFSGKGVSYCANCDGPLYRNKTVAVVGGGNSALDAADVLSKIAEKVYLIHRRHDFRAFEALVDEVKARKNIEVLTDSEIKKINGNQAINNLTVINVKTKALREIDVNGLFIEIGRIAHTDVVKELVDRDQYDQIVVDEKCRTKTDGLFAAGDVTTIPFKQITVASGQNTIAALAAYEYLQLKSGKSVSTTYDRSRPKVK